MILRGQSAFAGDFHMAKRTIVKHRAQNDSHRCHYGGLAGYKPARYSSTRTVLVPGETLTVSSLSNVGEGMGVSSEQTAADDAVFVHPAIFFAVPSVHLPFFGTMAKTLRSEQAVFLLDERGFDANATDSVSERAVALRAASNEQILRDRW